MKSKNNFLWFGGAIILIGITIYGILAFKSNKTVHQAPRLGDIEESVFGMGVVKSRSIFEFKPSLTYQIAKVFVTEGDFVKKGDLLLSLELGPLVRTPISGVVTKLPFRERENVFPQTLVARVEDLKDRYIEVAVEQSAAMRVRANLGASLSFESDRNQIYLAKIESIYPSESQFLVRILPNEDLPLNILPGMTVDVVIQVGKRENVLLIPVSSVVQGKVTRLREGQRQKVEVTTGLRNQAWIEVVKGDIGPDDQVLVPKEVKP